MPLVCPVTLAWGVWFMQRYIQLVYFLSPVVDITLFLEIIALFLLSLIAISLYPLCQILHRRL